MPRNALALVLLVVGALAGLVGTLALEASVVFAQDDGHDHGQGTKIVLEDLSIEDRQRARRLWSHVICSCPRENWSKTLANCPDGCSDPQKQVILMQVEDGLSDEEILAAQVTQWGTKVMAKPDDALTYALPIVFLFGCVGVVSLVLLSWRRKAAAARASHHMDVLPDADELSAVELELKELR